MRHAARVPKAREGGQATCRWRGKPPSSGLPAAPTPASKRVAVAPGQRAARTHPRALGPAMGLTVVQEDPWGLLVLVLVLQDRVNGVDGVRLHRLSGRPTVCRTSRETQSPAQVKSS